MSSVGGGPFIQRDRAEVDKGAVEAALAQIVDPNTGQDLVTGKAVKGIGVDAGKVAVEIVLGYPAAGSREALAARIVDHLEALPGVDSATVGVDWKITPHRVQEGLVPNDNVRNIIAVASGKGGVGKSTTAVNLALALQADGASVGILDADVYGPSLPRMLGLSGKPDTKDGRTLEPKEAYGLQCMSIGFLVEEDTPMIWRGPMATQALQQLFGETSWRDLDYLVVDLPPGTGDIQLTLAQRIPVSGAVIVTTPQDIALLDARKGYKMFEKVEVPVLGVVENMSTHICSECGHEEHIFGAGGGERMSQDFDVAFLGSLPLDIRIREQTDGGKPTVEAEPDSSIAAAYREVARRAAGQLSVQSRNLAMRMPEIKIENT